MIIVQVRDDHLEEALVLLKRQCQKDGLHFEIRMRELNAKPSSRRKAKEAIAKQRRLKIERKREQRQGKNGR
jgi:ribosomal protein S21